MQIISKRLKCLEGFLEVWPCVCDRIPPLSLVLVYYHDYYVNKHEINLFINRKRTNITTCNWVKLHVRLLSLSGRFPRFPAVSSAPQRVGGAELTSTRRRCRETQQIQKDPQKSRSNSLFLSVMLWGCSGAGHWGREDVKTTNYHQHEAVFLHLSIFTHKMYMIGMHIIFLLTDGFNKALCQTTAVVSMFSFCF